MKRTIKFKTIVPWTTETGVRYRIHGGFSRKQPCPTDIEIKMHCQLEKYFKLLINHATIFGILLDCFSDHH